MEEIMNALGISLKTLRKSFEVISKKYREDQGHVLKSMEEKLAYVVARFPATSAAVRFVFQELKKRDPQFYPQSFLDLGAGPGTGMFAAEDCFSTIQTSFMVEKDCEFSSIGKRLIEQVGTMWMKKSTWIHQDLKNSFDVDCCDLTLLSYVLGEFTQIDAINLALRAWDLSKKFLVLIEPGTPKRYQMMMKIRTELLKKGAFLIAPCPHANQCPLQEDWCHFSVRIPRSSLHRQIKSGDLGYEDEKFFYLVLGKEKIEPSVSRIIRHPIKHSGFIELKICQKDGIYNQKITKQNENYQKIKKLSWGDELK